MVSQQPDESPPEKEKKAITARKRPFRISIGFLFSLFVLAFLVYPLIGGVGVKAQEIPGPAPNGHEPLQGEASATAEVLYHA